MKRGIVFILGIALLLSGCSSNTASGAYVGGQFGHVIGSAIGGISGGWRGHHTGSLIGTVGGVVAGAAIGSAVDHAQEKKRQEAMGVRDNASQHTSHHRDSGYDPRGRGDDRIFFTSEDNPLEIRNAMIVESNHDGVLTRGEECTVMFEIMNISDKTVYDITPLVEDVTGNKHVKISPNLHVESIAPHQGVRYTATIIGDKKLKDGEIQVLIGVAQGGQEITSQTRQFTVPTAKQAR